MSSIFTSWDVLGISLVLSLRFLGPFALGVSIVAWSAFRPARSGARRRSFMGIALGLLVCLAPILLFFTTEIFG